MYQNQDTKFVQVFEPVAIVNNGSWTQATPGYVDTQGFHSVLYLFNFGAMDIAMGVLKVTECDTSGGSYTDIPLADFSVSPLTLPSATDDHHIFAARIPVNGLRKRYQKVTATGGNGSLGTFMSAVAILGNAEASPYDATTQGFTQLAVVAG